MAQNEAKVKFTADAAEFTAAISAASRQMVELQSALRLNATQMSTMGQSVDTLTQRQKLLAQQAQTLADKKAALTEKLRLAEQYFGSDSTEAGRLRTQLNNLETQSVKLEGEIAQTAQALAQQEAAESKAETATERLTNQISQQESELADLKRQYVNAVLEYGEASDEAQGLAQRITDLSGELRENKTTLQDAQQAAGDLASAVDDAAGCAEDAADGGISSLNVAIGNLAATAVEKGVEALVHLGKASIGAAQELDEGYDTIITKTGASGEALESLNEVARAVYSNMPVEMADVGTAVGELNTRFGSTGNELEDLSKLFLQFASINEVDVNNSIDTVDKIMNQWGIDASETANVLGLLTDAGQRTGLSVDSLMSSVSDNSASFKQLGFSMEESIGLLAQLEENGVDVSTAVTGLKKSVTNLTDAGMDEQEALTAVIDSIKNAKTDTEALTIAQETFGTKGAAEMATAIREGRLDLEDLTSSMDDYGTTVEDTFNATLDPWDDATVAINNLKIAGAALATNALTVVQPVLQAAIPVVQDLSAGFSSMTEAVRSASEWCRQHQTIVSMLAIGIGGLTAAIGVYQTAQLLANAGAVSAGMIKTGETAAITAHTVALGIETAATTAATAATSAFGAVMAFVTSPITLVVLAITALIAIGVALYKNWDKITAFAGELRDNLTEIFDGIRQSISEKIQAAADTLSGIWTSVTSAASSVWNGIKSTVSTAASNVYNTVSQKWNSVKSTTSSAFNLVKSTASSAWSGITSTVSSAASSIYSTVSQRWSSVRSATSTAFTSVRSTLSTAWSGITSTVSSAASSVLNTVTSKFSSISSKISSVMNSAKNAVSTAISAIKSKFNFSWSLPKLKLPHITISGKFSLTPPSVPKFSISWYKEGGILQAPTIFGASGSTLLGGGEAGPEAVAPIDVLQDYVSAAVQRTISTSMSGLAAAIQAIADRPIYLQINGRTFAVATAGDTDDVLGTRQALTARGLCL